VSRSSQGAWAASATNGGRPYIRLLFFFQLPSFCNSLRVPQHQSNESPADLESLKLSREEQRKACSPLVLRG
jgi:hypothetical protein